MALQVNLEKESTKKLSLNLTKSLPFKVTLQWSGKEDLDLHALLAINSGNGAKVSSFDDLLSTYNVQRTLADGQKVGHLPKKADGTFEIYGGAMTHSKDATTGDDSQGDDEFITITVDKLPQVSPGTNIEIPLLAMIHPQSAGKTFRDIQDAKVVVTDTNGNSVLEASLSSEFGQYDIVQMGAVMVDSSRQVVFAPVGAGLTGDFNTVLEYFS